MPVSPRKGNEAPRGRAWHGAMSGLGPICASKQTSSWGCSIAGAEPALGCFGALKSVQEQSQIITSAIGRPLPKAPPIISANPESRFASHGISRSYIPLLHRAPTGIRPSPKDERSQKQTSGQGRDAFGIQALPEPEREAECLWLRQG
jgi:hypothetical protein